MKKIGVFLAPILSLAMVLPAMAAEQNASAAQVVISAGQEFGEDKVENLAGYANVNFFYNLNDSYAYLAGYVGPKMTFDDFNLYVMGVTFNDEFGWMVGPSLWLEVEGEKSYFFLEGDYYAPWLSTEGGKDPTLPEHQYYAYSEYSYLLEETTGIGMAAELGGSALEDRGYEFAFGPLFSFNRIKFWPFYDTTPDLPGQDLFGIRFTYVLE